MSPPSLTQRALSLDQPEQFSNSQSPGRRPGGFRASTSPVQWKVADGGNDHWYEAFSTPGISWSDAFADANARGGYLATILSAEENEFVFSLVDAPEFWYRAGSDPNTKGPWLGGFQPDGSVEPDGGREWLNNDGGFGAEDVGAYTNWHPPIDGSFEEPNEWTSGEYAVQFYSYNDFAAPVPSSFWNDEVGADKLQLTRRLMSVAYFLPAA